MMIQDETALSIEIFPWNENFETGIDRIDEQHRKLVALLNRMAMHFANRSGEVQLNATFQELADYADYHFRAEEAIWSERLGGDDAYLHHLASHHSFIGEVTLLKENKEGKVLDEVIYEVISFLSKWLAFHILESDNRMAKIVLAMDEGASMEKAKLQADEHMAGATKVLVNTVLKMYATLTANALTLMREKALRRKAEEDLCRSEERWQVLLEGGVENVWEWNVAQNPAAFKQDELPILKIVGGHQTPEYQPMIHPSDIEMLKHNFEAHLRGDSEVFTAQYRILRDNGSWAWFLSRGKVVSRDETGQPLRMVGTRSDITERELASQIFKNSSQAMMICDMNNKIISINPAFTEVTGYTIDEVAGEDPKILSSGRHGDTFFQEMWDTILKEGQWQGEVYNRRKNGEIFPGLLMINTVQDYRGEIDHYFAIFDDISEQKRADTLIFQQANFDALTQLPNRRMFLEKLDDEIKRSQQSGIPCALLFIDLDHFKEINDTMGHETGDKLLLEASQRIVKGIHRNDAVAHLGGDKFAVIVSKVKELTGLEKKAQKLIDALSHPYRLDGNTIHASASIGLTLYPYDAEDVSTLLKHAEQAMYMVKRSGRGRYGYFTPEMQAQARQRQRMLVDLHQALAVGEFEICYQPIVDLEGGAICKAEALLRWHHPKLGAVSPEVFIPLAEESGLIIEIGDWVYREATRQAKAWQERYEPAFQISINKSPVQFREADTVERWSEHLNAIGLPGSNSVIEITESFMMEHEGLVAEKLAQLRERGVSISLDDFGTGYSSLAYLQKFQIDYLKIDKSFVSHLDPDTASDATLCEAIITMAHKLGIKVIAEGIETSYQQQLLAGMKCDYGQGYYFSKPVSAAAFEKLLQQGTFETL